MFDLNVTKTVSTLIMRNINNANKSCAPNKKKTVVYNTKVMKINREYFPSREAIDIIIFIIVLYYYHYNNCNTYTRVV